MDPRTMRMWSAGIALLLIGILLGQATAAGAPLPARPAGLARSANPSDLGAALPSVLRAPWADRAGFSVAYATEAADPRPAGGSVRVHVTLAPTTAALFTAPGPGAVPLTLSQIADRFGRSPAQYAALTAYFTGQGLTVSDPDPARLGFSVEGPSALIERAFGTPLENGTYRGAEVRYPLNTPVLPAGIAAQIAAISGLSEGFDRFTLPIDGVGLVPPTPAAARAARTTNAITASALHQAYGLNDLYNFSGGTHWSTGEAIAILLWGDGFNPADVDAFYNQDYPAGFPQINISWFPVDGAPAPSAGAANDPSNAPQELTLDLEYAGSAAPGATLDAVYAPDGPANRGYSPSDADMESALTTAADLAHVRAISMSFGTPDGSDPSFQASFETAFAVATQREITLLGASGDNGGLPVSGSCPAGGPAPQYPAASPQVLAVGGSSPELSQTVFGTVNGLASESAWNGSGGGFSTTYGAPTWQTDSGASGLIPAGSHRGLPDVAGPSTYNRFYYNGQAMAGNGTSFATPFWAGMITEMDALLPEPLGFVTPRLYSIATAEVNHTKALGLVPVDGESGPTCNAAAPGWNSATGWGSPRAGLLYEDLIGTYVDVTLHGLPADVAPAGTIDLSVEVLNASSLHPIDGLPVQISLGATAGYLGPCGGTLDTVTATTDADGNASVGLPVSGCYLGSAVVVSVTVLADGYFGNISSTVRVNLLGLAGFLAIAQVYPYNVVVFGGIMLASIVLGVALGRVRRRRAARRALFRRPSPSGAAAPAPGGAGSAPSPPPASPPPPPSIPVAPAPPAGVEPGPPGGKPVVPPAPPVVPGAPIPYDPAPPKAPPT